VRLRDWLEERDEESLFLSVITFGELRQGTEMIRSDAKKRARLEHALGDVQGRFAGRILDIDQVVAETWGEIRGRARLESGGPLAAVDALIAATAIVHRLVVVTGNVRDFRRTGASVLDPFEKA
jgi:predicted nucleic acid-binding protein